MRNYVRTILASATLTAGILALTAPASAAVTLCTVTGPATAERPSCAPTTVQVLVNGPSGKNVTATDNDNNTSVNYLFSSNEVLIGGGSGQAGVIASDGVINDVTFQILNGTSNLITFNLVPLNGSSTGINANSVTVTYLGAISQVAKTTTFALSSTGNNFFGIQANGGDLLTGLTFNFDPATSGIQALEQVRLNVKQTSPVPEPATWMLMLLGMAGVGFTMRRKEKQTLRVRYA